MRQSSPLATVSRPWALVLAGLALLLSMPWGVVPTFAQSPRAVQELSGRTASGNGAVYSLADLQAGDVLYVYVQGTSGNLDPFAAILKPEVDISTLSTDFYGQVGEALQSGQDPLVAVPEIVGQFTLAWDDDGGEGYDAALQLRLPADGTYQLLVTSSLIKPSSGAFHLLLGVNAPAVLTGDATPTGAVIATLDPRAAPPDAGVQEVTGTLSATKRSTFYNLQDFEPGDAFYAFAETTTGSLRPILELQDFGGKAVRSGNFSGGDTTASLQYTFPEGGTNYRLVVRSCCDDGQTITTGGYRLLVGLNTPDVLEGRSMPSGSRVLKPPIDVRIGLRMDQITGVDQKAENFGAVADLRMEWSDPALAFSPDTCDCRFKTLSVADFTKFASENGITWPLFTLYNQQNNRWSQNPTVAFDFNGNAIYLERFTTTFQAPDFDFRLFPFDTQQFYMRVDSIYPTEYITFSDLPGFSGTGQQLGEEEWYITDYGTEIETVPKPDVISRFSFGFQAQRHLSYYAFRIFLPVLMIILVSWVTFFLKDYGKRIDVASANLLLFIAFNFTISNDIPRLGYLTLMDVILVVTFIITGLVIIFNVYLKWLQVNKKGSVAQRIDKFMIWLYPVAYIVGYLVVSFLFS